MNWKGCRRKRVWLNFSYYLEICQTGPEKPVKTIDVPVDVWTGNLTNISQNVVIWTHLLNHKFLLFNMYYHKHIHGSTILNSSSDLDKGRLNYYLITNKHSTLQNCMVIKTLKKRNYWMKVQLSNKFSDTTKIKIFINSLFTSTTSNYNIWYCVKYIHHKKRISHVCGHYTQIRKCFYVRTNYILVLLKWNSAYLMRYTSHTEVAQSNYEKMHIHKINLDYVTMHLIY
jgi:hypothetical protein